MQEQIIRFGPNNSLVGVLNLAKASSNNSNSSPIAILLNAGIVHRVGPYRLNVDIARRLADAGVSSCRIDLSGLGDSATRNDALDATQRGVQDAQDLFQSLNKLTGEDQFVVIGLCSGSYHAHQLGLADTRVVGGVFIDGYTFATAQHRQRTILGKLKYRFLRNALKRRLLKLKPTEQNDESGSQPAEFGFFDQNKTSAAVANELSEMLRQDKQLMFVYTGGNPDISSETQFSEMFDLPIDGPGTEVHYLPKSEHTFPRVECRHHLVDLIVQWYRKRFPVRGESPHMACSEKPTESISSSSEPSNHEVAVDVVAVELDVANIDSPTALPNALGNEHELSCISPWSFAPSPLAIPNQQSAR